MPRPPHRRSILDRNFLLAFFIAFLALASSQAEAGQGPELILTNGTRSPATLTEFAYTPPTTTWRFANTWGEPLGSSPTNQLVRWGHPAKAKRAATLILRDGSIIISDRTWSASGYVRVNEESIGLNRRACWATVKRSEAKWLLLEAAIEGTRKEELLRSIIGKRHENDLVWLVGGDQITGVVQTIEGSEASILLGDNTTPIEVPVSRIRAIRFGSKLNDKRQEPVCLVGLKDGTLLVAQSVQVLDEKAHIKTLAGLHLEIAAETIVFLQPTGGDHQEASSGQKTSKPPPVLRHAIKYLSDWEADDYRSTPYFDLEWPYARDVLLDGTPLKAGGRQYAKGLAMHSASRLVYQLGNDPSLRFQAEIAIADSDLSVGSVAFRVYALRDGKVKPLYESPIVRSGDNPLPIDVDLSGAAAIVLVVDYADNGDTGDQALWLDARLVSP